MDKIDVLLAVHNGANFLKTQIDSIIKQTHQNWRLLVRDDHSNDESYEILNRYSRKYPDKIIMINDGNGNLGASGNFMKLMEHTDADYVMFCDQDDYWYPEKMEYSIRKMKEMKNGNGSDIPLLVHTDLQVADQNLKLRSKSFWKYQSLKPENSTSINHLLISNVVTGCTTMFNRKLMELAMPVKDYIIMHDWWLALVTTAFGKVGYLSHPTVLYRQHPKNTIGAKNLSFKFILNRITNPETILHGIGLTFRQANTLLKHYRSILSPWQKEMIEAYTSLPKLTFMEKRKILFKYNIFKGNILRDIALLIYV